MPCTHRRPLALSSQRSESTANSDVPGATLPMSTSTVRPDTRALRGRPARKASAGTGTLTSTSRAVVTGPVLRTCTR